MLQIANLKISCTDSTEAFSKLRFAGLNHHLPKLSVFSLTLTVHGVSNKCCFIDSFFI